MNSTNPTRFSPNLDPGGPTQPEPKIGFICVYKYITHWDFLPKFLSLHCYTILESVLGVQRSGQAQGTIICLFGPLFFSQNGMTLKKTYKNYQTPAKSYCF